MRDYTRPVRESQICKFSGIKTPGGRLVANFISERWEISEKGRVSNWNVDRIPVADLPARFKLMALHDVDPDETRKAIAEYTSEFNEIVSHRKIQRIPGALEKAKADHDAFDFDFSS